MTDTVFTEFKPQPEDIRIKSVYWVRARKAGVSERPSLADAMRITGDGRLAARWDEPYALWFGNDGTFDEQLDALVQELPEYLSLILTDEEVPAASKINAIKVVAELAGKLGKSKEAGKDSSLPTTAEELKKFIGSRQHLLRLATGGAKDGKEE